MDKKGVVVILVIVVMMVMLFLGAAVLILTRTATISGGAERDRKRALYAAEAGIEKAIWKLNLDDENWTDTDLCPDNLYEELIYSAGDDAYAGKYTVILSNRSENDIMVTSTGEVNNIERKIRVRVAK